MDADEYKEKTIERSMNLYISRIERSLTVVTLIAGLDLAMYIYIRDINNCYAIFFGGLVIWAIVYLYYANRVGTSIAAQMVRVLLKYPIDLDRLSKKEALEKISKMQISDESYDLEVDRLADQVSTYMRNIRYFFNSIIGLNLIIFTIAFLLLLVI